MSSNQRQIQQAIQDSINNRRRLSLISGTSNNNLDNKSYDRVEIQNLKNDIIINSDDINFPGLPGSNILINENGSGLKDSFTLFTDLQNNKIGINNLNPLYDLDVTGDVKFNGAIYDSTNDSGTNGYVLTSTFTGWEWKAPVKSITQGNTWAQTLNWNSINNEWQITGDTNLALGNNAGQFNQQDNTIAIGNNAGNNSQGINSIAIGTNAGSTLQSLYSIAMGNNAGGNKQGNISIAIGWNAGQNTQGNQSIAIGYQAGQNTQGEQSVAIGSNAGNNSQGTKSISIGLEAGQNTQGEQSIAIGYQAGQNTQGEQSVAIGNFAGQTSQNIQSIAIGNSAGSNYQGLQCIAIGREAGATYQATNSIAIGTEAGQNYQGNNSIAIGIEAGQNYQGTNSIAIGNKAGNNTQAGNSIILNASGSILNSATQGFYVIPIRNITQTNVLGWDTKSKEITYYDLSSKLQDLEDRIQALESA